MQSTIEMDDTPLPTEAEPGAADGSVAEQEASQQHTGAGEKIQSEHSSDLDEIENQTDLDAANPDSKAAA